MQKVVDEARGKGAQLVVVLSHNGMDVDLKMASRVRGIDAIMGGHTHDGMPVASVVKNAGGQTLVTNAGSNGKFLGVLDFDVKNGKVADYRYKLLPVFANMLPADKEMDAQKMAAGLWALLHGYVSLENAHALPLSEEEVEAAFEQSIHALYICWVTVVPSGDTQELVDEDEQATAN